MSMIYKTNSDYSAQVVSGITIIIPVSENCPKFNGMMKLEGIGPFLWKIFESGSSFEDACKLVIQKYDVNADRVYKEVRLFIDSLLKNGLLIEI